MTFATTIRGMAADTKRVGKRLFLAALAASLLHSYVQHNGLDRPHMATRPHVSSAASR